eukprot:TRINITY_DN8360_c0_g1_i1.p1 TRINITY_DN8360_c0_g1~~TRINITY_DN8360_c0_g1_i1.p1  ORF type:complete len:264 (+),score=72.59 TRINITY_DN8360_c0_g1_i1:71-793(+)
MSSSKLPAKVSPLPAILLTPCSSSKEDINQDIPDPSQKPPSSTVVTPSASLHPSSNVRQGPDRIVKSPSPPNNQCKDCGLELPTRETLRLHNCDLKLTNQPMRRVRSHSANERLCHDEESNSRAKSSGEANLATTEEEGPIVIVSTSSEEEFVNVEEDNKSLDQVDDLADIASNNDNAAANSDEDMETEMIENGNSGDEMNDDNESFQLENPVYESSEKESSPELDLDRPLISAEELMNM